MGHLQHHFVELLFGLGIPFYSQGTCDPIFHTYKTGAQLLPLYFIEDPEGTLSENDDFPVDAEVSWIKTSQLLKLTGAILVEKTSPGSGLWMLYSNDQQCTDLQ